MMKNEKTSLMVNRLAEYRKQKELSQAQLAKLIGMAQSTIAMIETGKKMPSLRTALRLSRILGVPAEELFLVEEDAEDRK